MNISFEPFPKTYVSLPPRETSRDTRDLTTLQKVMTLINDELANALALEHGMVIETVTWEDTARTKGSCWGPNISDMTLQVKDENGIDQRMPSIRPPNFADKTHDVSIDYIKVR